MQFSTPRKNTLRRLAHSESTLWCVLAVLLAALFTVLYAMTPLDSRETQLELAAEESELEGPRGQTGEPIPTAEPLELEPLVAMLSGQPTHMSGTQHKLALEDNLYRV